MKKKKRRKLLRLEAKTVGLSPKELTRRLAEYKEHPRVAAPGRWWRKDKDNKNDETSS
jgi:hypothetical protein